MIKITTKQYEFIKKYLEYYGYENIEMNNIGDYIRDFQENNGLSVDGIVGPKTLWALQYEPVSGQEKQQFTKVAADKIGDGFDHFWIRQEMVKNYQNVYQEIKENKAILPSSGALRPLNASVSKGRSATSFHYTGLALDFYIWAGLKDPLKDPFILTLNPDIKNFHIYAVSNLPDYPEKTLDAYYIRDNRLSTKRISRPLFSLTDLLEKYGFTPIDIYPAFFEDPIKNYLTSEWWHFQYNSSLVQGCSLFGIELLKFYHEEDLKKSHPWDYREALFCKNGFYSNIDPSYFMNTNDI